MRAGTKSRVNGSSRPSRERQHGGEGGAPRSPVAETPEILRSVPLFSCFSRAELRHLTRLSAEEVYRKGDVVCREGDQVELGSVLVELEER